MSFSHQSNCWSKIKFPHKYHISMDILKTLHVQFCLCKTSSAYFQVLTVRCLQSFMHTPIEKNHPLLLVMDRSLLIQLILGVQILISAWWNFPNLLTLQILGGKISITDFLKQLQHFDVRSLKNGKYILVCLVMSPWYHHTFSDSFRILIHSF